MSQKPWSKGQNRRRWQERRELVLNEGLLCAKHLTCAVLESR